MEGGQEEGQGRVRERESGTEKRGGGGSEGGGGGQRERGEGAIRS